MSFKHSLIFMCFGFILTSCSVKKFKNIDYKTFQIEETPAPTLNIFTKRGTKDSLQPVLIFVHGGYWNSGRKEIYNYLGRNFARNEVTVVIPDYTKSPVASYKEMTAQIAQSIKWTQKNISIYGGDPNQIYITGHSAGGHLSALAVMNEQYGVETNTVKGIILNDAAGLDMYSYLLENKPTEQYNYISTWTLDPENWKAASPYYFIDEQTPEIKIYTGTKSYASIIAGNEKFVQELQKYQPKVQIEFLDKKHIPMVTQLFFPWNDRIDDIVAFMKK
ncbi:MAG: arylformamidase [Nonlabens sp.]|jgi:arylformamidase